MTSKAAEYYAKETERVWTIVAEQTEANLYQPIRDDGWNAWQIVAHIALTSRQILRLVQKQQQQAQTGDTSPIFAPDFDVDRMNIEQVAAWEGKSFGEIRQHWDKTGVQLAEYIATLQPADLALPVEFVKKQQMTLEQLLNLISLHIRLHRNEIETGLRSLE
ncbi:MAG: DinB family protein [Chloroflexi bacterium]|nr:DinB family protein [Chloroflexota bacterium]